MSAKIVDINGYEYGPRPILDDQKLRRNVCDTISRAYADARKEDYTKCVVIMADPDGNTIMNNSLNYAEQIGLLEMAKLDTYRNMGK